jgi:site-specific DNA recombinase
MGKRAALYSRVSTEEQAGDGRASLRAQMADMEEYCARRGYEIVERFVDIGSGADRNQERPRFKALREFISSGGADLVVVWRVDRISRHYEPAYLMREALDRTGTEIESATQGGALNRMMYSLLVMMGEGERESIIERTRMGARGKAKKGEYVGGYIPFGYERDPETRGLRPHPEEADTVRRVYAEYLDTGEPCLRSPGG